jgi:hypothetical protein
LTTVWSSYKVAQTTGKTLTPEALPPPIMLDILASGGLVLYMRQHGSFDV